MQKGMVSLAGIGLSIAVLAWAGVGRTEARRQAVESHRLNAEKIGQAAGTKATTAKDEVVRIGWPRTDVKVAVDGMPLKPFAGLGSWAALTPAGAPARAGRGAMVMG